MSVFRKRVPNAKIRVKSKLFYTFIWFIIINDFLANNAQYFPWPAFLYDNPTKKLSCINQYLIVYYATMF